MTITVEEKNDWVKTERKELEKKHSMSNINLWKAKGQYKQQQWVNLVLALLFHFLLSTLLKNKVDAIDDKERTRRRPFKYKREKEVTTMISSVLNTLFDSLLLWSSRCRRLFVCLAFKANFPMCPLFKNAQFKWNYSVRCWYWTSTSVLYMWDCVMDGEQWKWIKNHFPLVTYFLSRFVFVCFGSIRPNMKCKSTMSIFNQRKQSACEHLWISLPFRNQFYFFCVGKKRSKKSMSWKKKKKINGTIL